MIQNMPIMDRLEGAARRREVVSLHDPQGNELGALPLFKLDSGASGALHGVGSSHTGDVFVAVAHRRGPAGPTWDLTLVDSGYQDAGLGEDGVPVFAPEIPSGLITSRALETFTHSPLVRLELLGWTARLGGHATIRYGEDVMPRVIGDLRIVNRGPIRATDLVKNAPRAFSVGKIVELVGVTLMWHSREGFSLRDHATLTHVDTRYPYARRAL